MKSFISGDGWPRKKLDNWLIYDNLGYTEGILRLFFEGGEAMKRLATVLVPVSYTHLTLPTIYSV